MFSYVDLVRAEIACEIEERFGGNIPDLIQDRWWTLGDAARSVVGCASSPVSELEALDWIRTLIADGYGVLSELAQEEPVFRDYDRVTDWFMAPPLGYRLGDRWFARSQF